MTFPKPERATRGGVRGVDWTVARTTLTPLETKHHQPFLEPVLCLNLTKADLVCQRRCTGCELFASQLVTLKDSFSMRATDGKVRVVRCGRLSASADDAKGYVVCVDTKRRRHHKISVCDKTTGCSHGFVGDYSLDFPAVTSLLIYCRDICIFNIQNV